MKAGHDPSERGNVTAFVTAASFWPSRPRSLETPNPRKTEGSLYVGRPGFEPGTYGLKIHSSNRLSYRPEGPRYVAEPVTRVQPDCVKLHLWPNLGPVG